MLIHLISHRGNINGRIEDNENKPDYIDDTIRLGYEVEVDIWKINNEIFLGHDKTQYKINISWLDDRANKLWVHCKNIEALEFLNNFNYNINYFWHQEDTVTLTSKNHIWAYPGKQPIKNSIAVMPELCNDDVSSAIGVCSDFVEKYK